MQKPDKDRIEAFVKSNREAFDDKEPSAKVWQGVTEKLNVPKRRNTDYGFLWKVAAILFFATTAYLLWDKKEPQNVPEVNVSAMQQTDADFRDVEFYYTSLIEEKKEEINKFSMQGTDSLDEDMKKLDAMYLVLKEELNNNASSQVVDALILNLLIRIDLLNEQLDKLREIKNDQQSADKTSSV